MSWSWTTSKPAATAFVIGAGGLLEALNDSWIAVARDRFEYVIVGESRVLNF